MSASSALSTLTSAFCTDGVYKTGFATTQKAYEAAFHPLFASPDVEHADGLVSRCACHEVSIRRPGKGLDGVLVVMSAAMLSWEGKLSRCANDVQCRQHGGRPWVPELDHVVFASRNEESLGRMPLDTLDIPTMSFNIHEELSQKDY